MLAPKHGDADFVKILDFGLAKVAPEMLDDLEGDKPEVGITRHGSVFGTPRYMAPEQCVGDEVDGRVDLYALGLILYEALSGLHPFDERDPRRMIKHQLFTPIPPMRVRAPGVNIPASLEALVMRAVEKPRGKRFSNATELLAALAEVCEREGILPPEPSSRFATPRLGTPAGIIAARALSPSPRELSSDVMATQDNPGAVTADVVHATSTQNLSDAAATQDVSIPDQTQDLPHSEKTQDLPHSEKTQDLPHSEKTQDLPHSEKTQDLPHSEKTQDLPHSEKTQDLPSAELTKPPLPRAVVDDSPTQKPALAVDSMPTQPPRSVLPAKGAGSAPRSKTFFLLLIPAALLLVCLGLLALHSSRIPAARAPVAPPSPRADREHPPAESALPSTVASPAELSRATAAGAAALLPLVQKYQTDTRLPRALAQAYVTQGNGLEALRWQVRALALTENSIYDGEIMQAATLAMSEPESAAPALALLEHDFGTRGMDVLIALLNKPGLGRARSLISQSLTKQDARAHASPAALVALDLNQAAGCAAKHTLLARAARDGDQRTLQQLKALSVTRGCGTLHRSDCWPCLRKDGALRSAIAAISARASLAR